MKQVLKDLGFVNEDGTAMNWEEATARIQAEDAHNDSKTQKDPYVRLASMKYDPSMMGPQEAVWNEMLLSPQMKEAEKEMTEVLLKSSDERLMNTTAARNVPLTSQVYADINDPMPLRSEKPEWEIDPHPELPDNIELIRHRTRLQALRNLLSQKSRSAKFKDDITYNDIKSVASLSGKAKESKVKSEVFEKQQIDLQQMPGWSNSQRKTYMTELKQFLENV